MKISANNKSKAVLTLIIVFGTSVLFAQNWQSNFRQAQQLAANENKHLLLVFAGSDWCAPCIKLEKEIWESEEFKAYAKNHYVLYKADFPRKKSNKLPEELAKQNMQLAEKFNTRGYFPLVVIMNSEGKVLGETAYKKMTPKEYIEHLNSFINQ